MTVEQDFDEAIEVIGKPLFEPNGFALRQETQALLSRIHGHSFVRPRGPKFLEGVGLWVAGDPGRFTVELGVIPKDGHFFDAALSDEGAWLRFGRRERLGIIAHGPDAPVVVPDPIERDFFFFQDPGTLRDKLRRSLTLALEHGPSVWDRFATLLTEWTGS